jgi:hypothetical protein
MGILSAEGRFINTAPTPPACAVVGTKCPKLGWGPFTCASGTTDSGIANDIYGLAGCYPAPARFVVLGDSIAACAPAPDSCTPTLVTESARRDSFFPAC